MFFLNYKTIMTIVCGHSSRDVTIGSTAILKRPVCIFAIAIFFGARSDQKGGAEQTKLLAKAT